MVTKNAELGAIVIGLFLARSSIVGNLQVGFPAFQNVRSQHQSIGPATSSIASDTSGDGGLSERVPDSLNDPSFRKIVTFTKLGSALDWLNLTQSTKRSGF